MAATTLTQTVTATPGAASASTPFSVIAPNGSTALQSGSTTAPNIALVPLSKFDPNAGILLGARVSAKIPATVTVVVSATGPSIGSDRGVAGTAAYTGGVSAPGVTATGGGSIATDSSCAGGNCQNGSANNTKTSATTTFNGGGTVAASSLGAYYGTGTVGIATAGQLVVTTKGEKNTQGARADGIVNRLAGSSYSVAYDYLNFSQASFSGTSVLNTITLDFGTRGVRSAPVTLNFTLYNIGNANSAGFDLLSVARDNNNPLFKTNLGPFGGAAGNIDGGASRTFSVTFNPNTVLGVKTDTFRLTVADSAADVGNGLGGRQKEIAFNVNAFIVLPEPGTWATMIIGFGFIGAAARRRRYGAATTI